MHVPQPLRMIEYFKLALTNAPTTKILYLEGTYLPKIIHNLLHNHISNQACRSSYVLYTFKIFFFCFSSCCALEYVSEKAYGICFLSFLNIGE